LRYLADQFRATGFHQIFKLSSLLRRHSHNLVHDVQLMASSHAKAQANIIYRRSSSGLLSGEGSGTFLSVIIVHLLLLVE